jgi:transcriptional regulator with XRE-family HTH domain
MPGDFGTRVARFRANRRLTQEELAERAGLSRTYLARLERRRQDPTLTTLRRLAKALGIRVADLVE